jgi:hypothetical protein
MGQNHWLPCAQSTLSTTSATPLNLLFTIDAPHFLVVHLKALPNNHHMDAAATKPTPLPRNSFDGIPQFQIITTTRQIPHR